MKTLEQLEQRAREKHGNEINLQKIYENITREVYSGLNLIFNYDETGRSRVPDMFGLGDGEIDVISESEINLVVLFIIESYVENKKHLLRMQKPQGYDGFSRNKSFEDCLEIYNANYMKILEKLHSLRNGFRNLKASNPENYPCWIDEWESCFCVEVRFSHGRNVNVKSKQEIARNIRLAKYVSTIISCLFLRCHDLVEEYKTAKADPKRVERTFH